MLSDKLNQRLNEQMNKELFSAYSYLAASAYFEGEELTGFANFFKIQAQEELQHTMKFYDFINQVGGKIALDSISAPKSDFQGVLDVFESGLAQERELAAAINNLLDLAIEENHAPTRIFLQWFVTEQVEEESLFHHCIKRVKLGGQDGQGVLLLDQEFAKRSLAPADEA